MDGAKKQTGRSEGSVERKYMNVSAVLEKLGLPRIRGYAPNPHAQFPGLVAAIDRYLSENDPVVEIDAAVPAARVDDDPFVDPPTLLAREALSIGRPWSDDARDLVGERHCGQLELVFDRLALELEHGGAISRSAADRDRDAACVPGSDR